MTQAEFETELRRHIIAIVRACVLYYGWKLGDLSPKENVKITPKSEPIVIT